MSIINSIDDILLIMPPGTMTSDIVINTDTGKKEFVFIIKEDNFYLKNLSKYPPIEVVSGVFDIDNVFVIAFLMKFHDNPDVLYESYLNVYSTTRRDSLDILSKQNNFKILVYDEKDKEHRVLRLKNHLKEDLEKMKKISQTYSPWSMSQFDDAKEKIFKMFPDGFIMWDYLTGKAK